MQLLKKILKIGFIVLGVLVLLVIILFGILTITEYKPKDIESLTVSAKNVADSENVDKICTGEEKTIVTWNIGYGALGENAEFFMDGGDKVYTATKEEVVSNMNTIMEDVKNFNPDIMLIQEVDEPSSRSRSINEKEMLSSYFDTYYTSFAYNYKTLFVPYPVPPLGRVSSGIMTLSTYKPETADRIQLPCPFSYPVRLCNLKRCLLISRIPVDGTDKELVIINVHLEAYDSGEGKEAQTRMLAEILANEYDAGNYVIAGGDFNQTFTNTDITAYPVQREGLWTPSTIDVGKFGDNFTCVADSSVPTCRSLDQPLEGYKGSDFQYYMIDGFIVSSNIDIKSVNTIDMGFVNTDHNPVKMEFVLK
ncbi:MAG: endonuclease/exonuclease/phosphatase family protein [Coprococcus sp.]